MRVREDIDLLRLLAARDPPGVSWRDIEIRMGRAAVRRLWIDPPRREEGIMECKWCRKYATFALRFNRSPLEWFCDEHYVEAVMDGLNEGFITPDGGVMETIPITWPI